MDGAVGRGTEGKEVIRELCDEVRGVEDAGVEVKTGGEKGRILEERIRVWEEGSTGKAMIQRAQDGENSISKSHSLPSCRIRMLTFRQSSSLEPTFPNPPNRTRLSSRKLRHTFSSQMRSRSKAPSTTSKLHRRYQRLRQSTTHPLCHPPINSANSHGIRLTGS